VPAAGLCHGRKQHAHCDARRAPRQAKGGTRKSGLGQIIDTVSIRERPREAEDRGSLLEPVRSKQVRAFAVTSAKRFPDESELPTVAEAGVPGYDVSSWYGIYVPAQTPRDIVAKINSDIAAMLSDPTIEEKFKVLGVLPQGSTPQALAAMNVADAALWGPIIKEANIKIE
jgi:tripartite-type tricarboxylate transporter receptor subunit TctC